MARGPLVTRIAALRGQVRRLLALHGASWVLVGFVLAVLLAVSADWFVHLVPEVRFALLLGVVGAVGYLTFRHILRPLLVRFDDLSIALRIEERWPGLNDRLASTIEFLKVKDPAIGGSQALREATIEQTLKEVEGIDFREVVDPRPARKALGWAAATVALAVAVMAYNPLLGSIGLKRLFFPFRAEKWPQMTHLTILDETPRKVAKGEPFALAVAVRKGESAPSLGQVTYTFANGETQTERLSVSADGVYRGRLESVSRPFKLTVSAGDDETDPWAVDVVPPPVLSDVKVSFQAPPYTGLASQVLAPGNFQIKAVEGSKVEIRAKANKKLASVVLHQGDAGDSKKTPAPDAKKVAPPEVIVDPNGVDVVARFTIEESGPHWFELKDTDGFMNQEVTRFDVRAIKDEPPRVAINDPANDRDVPADAKIPVKLEADDDFGLNLIRLVYRVQSGSVGFLAEAGADGADANAPPPKPVNPEEVILPLWDAQNEKDTAPNGNIKGFKHHDAAYDWELSSLKLQPGATIFLHADARDFKEPNGPNLGRSREIRLRIVSRDEINRQLEDQQRAIRDEVERTLAMQRQAKTPVDEALRSIEQTGKLTEASKENLKNAEMIQRQVENRVNSKSDGLDAKLRNLQNDLQNFKVQNGDTERQVQAMRESVKRIRDQNLGPAEQALTRATKSIEGQQAQAGNDQNRQGEQQQGQQPQAGQQQGAQGQQDQPKGEQAGARNPNQDPAESQKGQQGESTKGAQSKGTQSKDATSKKQAGSQGKSQSGEAGKGEQSKAENAQGEQAGGEQSKGEQSKSGSASQKGQQGKSQQGKSQQGKSQQGGSQQKGEQGGEPQQGGEQQSGQEGGAQQQGQQQQGGSQQKGAQQKGSQPKGQQGQQGQQGRQQQGQPPKQELAQAQENQKAIEDELQKMLDNLKDFDNYRGAIKDGKALIQQQEQLMKQAAEAAAKPDLAGKAAENLDPEQKADLANLANRQNELARNLQNLESKMEEMAKKLDETDPLGAAALREAAQDSRKAATSAKMNEGAQRLERNQMGQARENQEQAQRDLKNLVDSLENRRERELARLVKELKKAEEELKNLRQRQTENLKKTQQARKNPDAKKRAEEIQKLAKEQQQIQQELKKQLQRLAKLRSDNAAQAGEQAASRMGKSQQNLEQDQGEEGEKEQQEALKNLRQAQQELAQDRRDAEEQLANEQIAKMTDALKSIGQRQEKMVADTTGYEKKREENGGKFTLGQRSGVRDLGRVQAGLKDETDELIERIGDGAPVFSLILKRATENMTDASKRLVAIQTDDETQRAEKTAANRFKQLIDSLKPDKGDQGQQQQQDQQQQQQQQQQQGDGIPPAAQLKMLKALQEELNERTEYFDELKRRGKELTEAQNLELARLRDDQGSLADLIRDMTKPRQEDGEEE